MHLSRATLLLERVKQRNADNPTPNPSLEHLQQKLEQHIEQLTSTSKVVI
jgi:hypothetical protein